MFKFCFVLLLVFLFSCSDDAPISPPQVWKNYQFRIETRPSFISAGMNEFLVIANEDGKRPAHDLLISLRIGQTGRWVQAIQDGHVGVFRRALRVTDPLTDALFIHIKDKKEDTDTVLEFPLAYGVKAP